MSTNPLLPVVIPAGGNVFQLPGRHEVRQIEAAAKEAGGETLRLQPVPPPAARSHYDIEQHLAALVDTEELVPDDQEQMYALELHATLLAVVEKRDRVGQFKGHLDSQIAFAHAEVKRLQAREAL